MRRDAIFTPCFLAAVDTKPRTLCACHDVACIMSASVAPLARLISCRILAPLLSGRGFLAAALGPFLADFAPQLEPAVRGSDAPCFPPLGVPLAPRALRRP